MMTSEQAGWAVAITGAIATATKYVWDYLKRKSDNDTKIKLHENGNAEITKQELIAQHKELLAKLDELETKLEHTERQLDKALTAFDIILPIFQKILEERPEYKGILDKALQHLTPKA